MYIIVVGAGGIGYNLVKTLMEEGHDVIAIDKDENICREISDELGVIAIAGDATRPKKLEDAGVREADVFIAVTGSDEVNLISSVIAKQMGAKKVATKLKTMRYDEEALKKMGIDVVIYPEVAAAEYIASMITKPEVLDLTFLARGWAGIVEARVKKEWIGKRVSEIKLPEGSAIIAIQRKQEFIIPRPSSLVKKDDRLLILAKTSVIKRLRKVLG